MNVFPGQSGTYARIRRAMRRDELAVLSFFRARYREFKTCDDFKGGECPFWPRGFSYHNAMRRLEKAGHIKLVNHAPKRYKVTGGGHWLVVKDEPVTKPV